MSDSSSSAQRLDSLATHPGNLAKLMSLADSASEWSSDDLAAILRHQLRVELTHDLSRIENADSRQTEMLTSTGAAPRQTFGKLLLESHPDIQLLRMTKDFAKASRADGESPLPQEVATALYYAAILVARLRCNERISELNDLDLRRGTEWVLSRTWVESPLRDLFEEAKTDLNPTT